MKSAIIKFGLILLLVGCSSGPPPDRSITIAAAANLNDAFTEIGKQFQAETGIKPVFSFGATGNLARQIENGAPFDLFAAADLHTVDDLEAKGAILPGSKRIYARGRLALWWSPDAKQIPASLADIAKPEFKRIALAKPDIAPYGAAAKESLEAMGLWAVAAPKAVYAENVNAVRQYAQTGNADLAFIPLSLVKPGEKFLIVDEKLHKPIDQALCIPKQSKQAAVAEQFDRFLAGQKGRAVLEQFGYVIP